MAERRVVEDVDLLEGDDAMVGEELIATHAHAASGENAGRSAATADAAGTALPSHSDDARFDAIVSAIEEAIMNPEFKARVDAWCVANCGEAARANCRHHRCAQCDPCADVFDATEENKLEYMPLFETYSGMLEGALHAAITSAIGPFDMAELEYFLTTRANEMSGDIFDLLVTLGDFEEFKSLMCSHKDEKHATGTSAAGGLRVSVTPLKPRAQVDDSIDDI